MLKRLFILVLIASFIGSNIYFFNSALSLFNFLMFILVCYILVFTKRKYDINFIVFQGIISVFILFGIFYLILFYRNFEQVKDFVYSTYIFNFCFIIYSAIKESKINFFKSFLNVMLVIEFFLLCIAFIEVRTGHHLPASTFYDTNKLFIPTTVFTNPNDLAVVVVMFFPLLFYLADYFESGRKKILLSLITIAIVILTMSRASLIMLLAFPMLNLLIRKKVQTVILLTFCLLGFALILFNLNLKYLPNQSSLFVRNYNRFLSLVNIKDNFTIANNSFHQRKQVAEIIWENPGEFIIGHGFRSGVIIIPKKKDIPITDPHSFFLEVIYNFGYFALIPVFLLIFIPLYLSLKYFGRHSIYRYTLVQTLYFIVLINVSSSIFRFPLVWVPFLTANLMMLTNKEEIFRKE